jgi:hypothetical protein
VSRLGADLAHGYGLTKAMLDTGQAQYFEPAQEHPDGSSASAACGDILIEANPGQCESVACRDLFLGKPAEPGSRRNMFS